MINTFDVYAATLQAAMTQLKSAGAHYYTKPNAGSYSVKDVEKGEDSVNEVDLSEFKSGVYFICIEVSDTEKYFKRVVLAK